MKSRYLVRYLGGAAAARAGDEMSGPALLLLGFAVTGRPSAGSELLAGLTIAAAAGGPAFGVLLDRSSRPGRMLAAALACYAAGIVVIQAATGRLPMPAVVPIALAAGLFSPAVAGGWSAQLPRIVAGRDLSRGSALDALSYSAASLAGPALAAVIAAASGARLAVLVSAGLVGLAVPAAIALPRRPPGPGPGQAGRPSPGPRPGQAGHRPPGPGPGPAAVPVPHRQLAAGFAAIVARRPLLRATVTSVVSYVGIGMLIVCCPVLGAHRLGGAARGALLISAIAIVSLAANAILARRPWRRAPDSLVFASTLTIGACMVAAALAPGWLTVPAVALSGAGEGPQLTALFAVRHRDAPEHMRGQIFTTGASLKLAGLAAGTALAGPLAGRSVTGCLLAAAGAQLCAAAAYLLLPARPGPSQAREAAGKEGDTTARSV
jgi:MFS family permease